MEAVLLPICSIFFSLLLCIAFFSKKRIKLIENNLYAIIKDIKYKKDTIDNDDLYNSIEKN